MDESRKSPPRGLVAEHELTCFVAVSLLDVAMTWKLLSEGGFAEANPVARYFLHHWGPHGMAYFKASMVLVVAVVTQIIARKQPETARRVLNLATLIVTLVVLYSVTLWARARFGLSQPFDAS